MSNRPNVACKARTTTTTPVELKAACKREQSQASLSFAEREQARPKVKGAQVYGIDISEESVAKAKKVNVNVLDKQVFVTLGSAEKLPYEDGKFDLVTAVETVYFWPNLPNFRFFQPSCGLFSYLCSVIGRCDI